MGEVPTSEGLQISLNWKVTPLHRNCAHLLVRFAPEANIHVYGYKVAVLKKVFLHSAEFHSVKGWHPIYPLFQHLEKGMNKLLFSSD